MLTKLYQSIQSRWRPEDVLHEILQLPINFTAAERTQLMKAAGPRSWSSMSANFAAAEGVDHQIAMAAKIFHRSAPTLLTPELVQAYIHELKADLGISGLDFKNHRLTRSERQRHQLDQSRRRYNKKFRVLQRLEHKFHRWTTNTHLQTLTQTAKSRLAYKITYADFAQEVYSACLIAYLTAKLNLRSVFTFGVQDRAYDKIAELFWQKLTPQSAWLALAFIYPEPSVLTNLTAVQKGALLEAWFQVMQEAAQILAQEATDPNLDLTYLVVRAGNDSSTWNAAAGAFNKAREGWLNTLYALDSEFILETFAPPKALRLMAADVVAGHSKFGSGGFQPDTLVWNDLPRPWDVLDGRAQCSRAMIEAACLKHQVRGQGWILPRTKTIAEFRPTPELVHGVIIGSPSLAQYLKNLGAFAGPSKN